MQPDTIVPDLSNPQSWNRYSYTLNNPTRYSDPTGHSIDCALGEQYCESGKLNVHKRANDLYLNKRYEDVKWGMTHYWASLKDEERSILQEGDWNEATYDDKEDLSIADRQHDPLTYIEAAVIGGGVFEQIDLCTCRMLASFSEEGDTRIITLDPVTIEFADFSILVQSIFRLTEGTGEVEIIRKILDSTKPEAEISIDEYITACYGTTEYPEDMTGIKLSLKNGNKSESIEYAYQCRESELENVHCAEAVIPQVDSLLSMRTDTSAIGYFREGFSFSPMYTIGIRKTVKTKGELRTWLKVAKAG